MTLAEETFDVMMCCYAFEFIVKSVLGCITCCCICCSESEEEREERIAEKNINYSKKVSNSFNYVDYSALCPEAIKVDPNSDLYKNEFVPVTDYDKEVVKEKITRVFILCNKGLEITFHTNFGDKTRTVCILKYVKYI